MDADNWTRLEKVNLYLNSLEDIGITKFTELIKKLELDSVSTCGIIFTYEYLEAYGKIDNEFKSYNDLSNTINNYEIDEIIYYDYDSNDSIEKYRFYNIYSQVNSLIKLWILNCLQRADKIQPNNISFFFKLAPLDLEILDLKTGKRFKEKTVLESFIDKNQDDAMILFGEIE